jgi:hypothetical protein
LRREPVDPTEDRHVVDLDATLGEQRFHVSVGQAEPAGDSAAVIARADRFGVGRVVWRSRMPCDSARSHGGGIAVRFWLVVGRGSV